jgi:hypothetical protein
MLILLGQGAGGATNRNPSLATMSRIRSRAW